ncbi:hypothetical protein GPECTOR_7g1343 [Gonium pectorale]|uniref:Uncharacterized protein n=1 Tax=Gonium pectorale TaxID=33097 RepID=A0A150GUI0_GONPE|nr:hypothetical protein GPECTOR_7g1343 [Gonium pectorale]|eukprot:KXZ53444.1 hypothetical protein GPECTOR_7g1343 [Gonium pectorale]
MWVGGKLADVDNTPSAVGPTTYFVSHAWSYNFSDLISLVERHYAELPGTDKGKTFTPVYYWVDILAVTQHFKGQFTDHPDSDFPGTGMGTGTGTSTGVIRASKAVLFTMYPWRSPIAPTRVWCLFEALTAVQSEGVDLEVLLDTGGSEDTAAATVLTVTASIDVRSAQAVLLSVSFKVATNANDTDALVSLITAGAGRVGGDVLDIPRALPFGRAEHVVAILNGLSPPNLPRKLVLAGYYAGYDDGNAWYYVGMQRPRVAQQPGQRGSSQPPRAKGGPTFAYLPLKGKVLAAVTELLKRQEYPSGGGRRDAEARDAAERPARERAERAARSALWRALGADSSLTVLGLYDGWLGQEDVAALGRALGQHRTIRELHVLSAHGSGGSGGGGVSRAAIGPRAAALTHYLCTINGPAALEDVRIFAEEDVRACLSSLQAEMQKLEGPRKDLQRLAMQAAPPKYVEMLNTVFPPRLLRDAKYAK